ncbi:hypothetical protein ASF28_18755 [Methylobacterium sp. Leaf99]|jgi:hypothetical protein|uniref:hypothetical protein n=1 Tax=Methylobacterium sp. Leaf99 TaxID=1736251 RepID=UPI0006F58387|nr:hypothetical protein [Methylobacterium sp. Leaf99]KQP04871.1 hypothetical protein ASF28_18755 [Methylobacterium sp. Leaf99]
MTDELPPPATALSAPPERLVEVSRLATLLAEQVLDAQIMKLPVPDDHIRVLLDAGLLLREYGIELPSLLGQIMLAAEGPKMEVAAEPWRLAQVLRPFQRTNG